MIFGLIAGGRCCADDRASPDRDKRRASPSGLAGVGVAGLAAGAALHLLGINPIVKRIWTPAWTLFSTGWVVLILAAYYYVVDLRGHRRWTFPLLVVGMNSIAMYVHRPRRDRLHVRDADDALRTKRPDGRGQAVHADRAGGRDAAGVLAGVAVDVQAAGLYTDLESTPRLPTPNSQGESFVERFRLEVGSWEVGVRENPFRYSRVRNWLAASLFVTRIALAS